MNSVETYCMQEAVLESYLCVYAIWSSVVTLDHLRNECSTASRSSDTLQLWNRTGAPCRGVASTVEREHLNITQ